MKRWWAPLGIIWLQWLLSAYILEKKIPPELRDNASSVLTGTLVALPLTSMLLLALLHRIDRCGDGHFVILWTMTFLFAAHALVLSVVVGLLSDLHAPLVTTTGGWLVGMGALVGHLPVGSPMGLSVKGLANAPGPWRRVHGVVGGVIVGLGIGMLLQGYSSW